MRVKPYQIDTPGATADKSLVYDPATDEWLPKTVVRAVVAGTNVTVDNTDPARPVIAAGGGGGGSLTVQDENGTVATGVTQIDFQGAGVTATAGTGEVVVTIPGGGSGGSSWPLGSADAPPTTANAKDDEFDGTSTVTWTATPTAPAATNVNSTRAGHLYISSVAGSGAWQGRHQPVPGSYPYTFTAKCSANLRSGNARAGVFLAPTGATGSTNGTQIGWVRNDNGFRRTVQTLNGTFVSNQGVVGTAPGGGQPFYLKVTVASATSMSWWASFDGWSWMPGESAVNPGFTPGVMGVYLSEESASGGVFGFFDWFRVT